MDGLTTEPRQMHTIEQCRSFFTSMKRGDVAEVALCLIEHLLTNAHEFALANLLVSILHHFRFRTKAASWHTEAVQIKVDILHFLGRYVELVIEEPHHAALRHLQLPLTDFLRVAAIGHTHIARETEFHGEVLMLRLITR